MAADRFRWRPCRQFFSRLSDRALGSLSCYPNTSTKAELVPGCSSLERSGQDTEVEFEPRILRSVNSRFNY
ncbi:hypothetical protein T265_04734 [Opisthorchis viverrini]|uniref:Uncharacterized protein n=1 Tax=Opisthorchis viverrini TaxID=6198 RepID=A0A075AG60_OPIVI|nr:hypothetical protein T265_04734 [Opisthorchis viverrini]KER28424.1 hypothetical protein T265_04734 [Opisthorchis viverrini]